MENAATGGVRATMRLEGLVLLAVAVLAYFKLGFAGWQFGVFLLVPDLSMLGYLVGPRIGALSYNSAHSSIGPLALLALGLVAPPLVPYALIWLAHVGMDRALGYGLKYGAGFRFTHLGMIGR